MKPRRFHGLKRPKLRQSWNKYNLFNLWRAQDPRSDENGQGTFFQQKWKAKGLLRTYHGEHIVERKWTRMFSRRLLSVVDMDTKYMAKYDGSELAAGRGSGHDQEPKWDAETVNTRTRTPYMQMTFAPMERRLDIAVFRAMFASSARQARQFCVHGHVKVNGKVVPYPAYRLNPGDMFQVDVDRVLNATGRNSFPFERSRSYRTLLRAGAIEPGTKSLPYLEPVPGRTLPEEAEAQQDPETTDAPEPEPVDMRPMREQIKEYMEKAKRIVHDNPLKVKEKVSLRRFLRGAKLLLSRSGRHDVQPADIASELSSLASELELSDDKRTPEKEATSDEQDVIESLSESEKKHLAARMERFGAYMERIRRDPSKPYFTPWRPRRYMAPFALIPQYLEVNQNICAAVYLRHPVARKGSAEVPTPYPAATNQLAFNWYLRRR